jgi:hypothetical protein
MGWTLRSDKDMDVVGAPGITADHVLVLSTKRVSLIGPPTARTRSPGTHAPPFARHRNPW